MILSSVLLGLSLLPFKEVTYPPAFLNTMFMLRHVFTNSKDIAISPSSANCMNEKSFILITQCSDNKFEDVNIWTFDSVWKPKGL